MFLHSPQNMFDKKFKATDRRVEARLGRLTTGLEDPELLTSLERERLNKVAHLAGLWAGDIDIMIAR